MAERRSRRRGLVWAVAGGLVAVAAVIVAAVVATNSSGDTAAPRTPPTASASPVAPLPTPLPDGDAVVDPTVVDSGWVPEPITTDAESYLRAAITAAGTVNTTLSTREDWVAYLDTWFTLDPRLEDADEQAAQTERYQLTMRDAVVFPQQVWDSLAAQQGRVSAATAGEMEIMPVPDYPGDDMFIGTTHVVLTFTEADAAGVEASYEEQVRVSAQVLCGEESIPTPGSAQAAGDCKLIRYFDQALSE